MKLTAKDARTYLVMMEGREHAPSRNGRLEQFLKDEHCEVRTVVVSLNVADRDYFDLMLAEDQYLNDEERDLCERMVKEYNDYAAAKTQAKKKAEPAEVEPEQVETPMVVEIKKGDTVRIKADGTEHEVTKGTKKPDGKIKVKTEDGQLTLNAEDVEII